jgi:hypothetical protein
MEGCNRGRRQASTTKKEEKLMRRYSVLLILYDHYLSVLVLGKETRTGGAGKRKPLARWN